MMEWRETIQAVGEVLQLFCITQVAVVCLATYYPVVVVVCEVDGSDSNNTLVFSLSTILVVWIRVADGMTIVSAQTDA